MAQLGAFLRSKGDHRAYWCQGCQHAHVMRVNSALHPSWSFDGNIEAPTFNPSYREFERAHTDKDGVEHPEHTLCHVFVRVGQIQFLGDCDHDLKGQTLPLEPFPSDYSCLD